MAATTGNNVLPDVQVQATPISQAAPPVPAAPQGSSQFLRRWSVVVHSQTGLVLELSAGTDPSGQGTATGIPITNPQGQILSEGLRMDFKTFAADYNVPNHLEVTIFNLADDTARSVLNQEFAYVVLQAGYVHGRYGVIFNGTIKEVRRGRLENAVDTFLTIYAADGDWVSNHYVVNNGDGIELQRNSELNDRVKALAADAIKNGGAVTGDIQAAVGVAGVLPRGKFLYGAGDAAMNTTAGPYYQWSIENGAINFRPLDGYKAGEVVVLNVHSGLIGVPQADTNGVFATCLLNPAIKVKSLIQINNGAVNTTEPAVAFTQVQQLGYPGYSDINLYANTSDDGTYIVVFIEHEGSTRANSWYTKLGCLLQDPGTKKIAPIASPNSQTIEQAFDNARGSGQAFEFEIPTS